MSCSLLKFLGIFLILSAILSTFRCNRSLSGIVFVIYPADKRHHTRIFQTDSRDICTEKQKIGGHKRKYAVLGKIAQPIFDPLRKRCFISVHCISPCQYYSAGAAARLLPKDSFLLRKISICSSGKTWHEKYLENNMHIFYNKCAVYSRIKRSRNEVISCIGTPYWITE